MDMNIEVKIIGEGLGYFHLGESYLIETPPNLDEYARDCWGKEQAVYSELVYYPHNGAMQIWLTRSSDRDEDYRWFKVNAENIPKYKAVIDEWKKSKYKAVIDE